MDDRLDRFERQVSTTFAAVDAGFVEMRGTFDQLAAGQQRIVDLQMTVVEDRGDR